MGFSTVPPPLSSGNTSVFLWFPYQTRSKAYHKHRDSDSYLILVSTTRNISENSKSGLFQMFCNYFFVHIKGINQNSFSLFSKYISAPILCSSQYSINFLFDSALSILTLTCSVTICFYTNLLFSNIILI